MQWFIMKIEECGGALVFMAIQKVIKEPYLDTFEKVSKSLILS